MELDYKNFREMLQIRKKQIQDDALVYEMSNLEDRMIDELVKSLNVIIVAEKYPPEEVPAVGEILGDYQPIVSESGLANLPPAG